MAVTRIEEGERGYQVVQAIRRIIRRVSSHSRLMAQRTGLTLPQLLSLRAIDESDADEVTLASVADAVHLSRSTVSGVIERLVKAGLISRARSSVDRRRLHLSLTGSGRDKLASAPAPLQDRFLARLDALPRSEQQALLSALHRIVEMMDAEDLDAAPMLLPGEKVPPGS